MRPGFRRIGIKYANPYGRRVIKLRFLSWLSSLSILTIIFGTFAFIILFLWYSKNLPSPDKVVRREGFSTVILDRSEKPIYDLYTDKNRIPVPLSDIPEIVKKATIAVEDKDFYKHQGFDPKGILRAIFNILTLRGLQGGSTLTQQLVKNVLLSSERTLPRKIKEFILSVQIERKYRKDEILQMYLNEAPYGGTKYGIESAAKGYFGKSVKELNLAESVILAGLPQKPSAYSPFGSNPKAYKGRAEEVLRRMREDGYITQREEFEAKRELGSVKFASPGAEFVSPHFVFYVKKLLTAQFGGKLVDEGGLKVITTLDLDLQKKTEAIVKEELDKLKTLNVGNGASLVLDPQTGEILAYVGSKEYDSENTEFEGKYDVVSQGLRQPGSALKPITYAAAFSKGYTPATLIMDAETKFPGGEGKPDYVPKNYDNKFRGPVQIRYALGNSINLPAVKMTALVGIRDILKTAYDMGISSFESTDENITRLGLALTLGGGEVRLLDLTGAYGVLATGGIKNETIAILKVIDKDGMTIFENKKKTGRRVLGEDVSFLVSHILSDNGARKEVFGERSYLAIPGFTVAAKTGTTDDKRDNWTVGYTPSIVVSVWVGNNDNSPMNPKLASGATGAAPIWNRIIKESLRKKNDESFKKPDNVISLDIDAFAGGIPKEGKPTRTEYFIKGTEPASVSPIYQKLKLSKSDKNKLANAVEIAQGNYEEKDFIVFNEDDPTSRDEKNRWQEGIDKWLETQADPLYHPPKEISASQQETVVARIKKPADKEKIDSNSVQVLADAKAIRDIKKLELYADGSLKTSVNANILDETLNLDKGIHKIKVKAYDSDNHSGESEITIGVKVPAEPTVTSVPPTSIPSPTP